MTLAPNVSIEQRKDSSALRIVRANFSDTVVSGVRTWGRTVDLAIESVREGLLDLVRGRFQWREMLHQAWYMVTVTALPAILMAVPFGVIVSVQIGNMIRELGGDSLLGAASGLGVIKQGAPIATGLLLGGAGAAAIAADLGARTIREEVDALRVMGVSPVRRLVIPRIAAMVLVAPLLNVLIIFTGVAAGYIVAISAQGVTSGSYWATFGSFTTVTDVGISLLEAILFGFIVAVIGCQRGLEARGGPRGVADGVNASVVLSVVSVLVVNLVVSQLVQMFVPTRMA
ncbi:MlaE family ABC transporter permease [Nocardia amamiensis]|uniref:MlaE family ABC transporter permease n=1 Tax=Nocardia amamiensis TaxID=404578 RepID=UPI001FDF5534|nr:ABC transporter permease [Nocardia amamiensis]